jgi:GNAT superfamily N-acetyltransferase
METLRDGSQVTVRPIKKGDIELERRFIEELSPEARRFRFLGGMSAPSDALLQKLTLLDAEREAALIAVTDAAGGPREVGVARFSALPDGTAEVAVTVSDDWRHRGLATLLLNRLAGIARVRGIRSLYSIDAGNNAAMREFAAHMGFERRTDPEDATQVIYTLNLPPSAG